MLKDQITQGKFDEAVRQVTVFDLSKNKEYIPVLIKYLDTTENSALRNAIAIALSDIGCVEAIEHILALLKDPKTCGDRGTLLYALQEFDISCQIATIVDFLFDDGFEVSRQALSLIQSNLSKISPETVSSIIESIRIKIRKMEEKFCFLDEVLEILEQE